MSLDPAQLKYLDARILIYCKAPVPWKVKTRLIPTLSPCGAADIYRRLAGRMIDCSLQSRLAEVQLWCYPDIRHEFFCRYARAGVGIHPQQGIDLGDRMYQGAKHALSEPGINKVLIVGSDCPTIDEHYLDDALEKLNSHDAVLGPAEDGGYGLIGLTRAEPGLFTNIVWSTNNVCAETCRRMNKFNYSWSLLPLLWDVDRPEDLERLRHA